MSSVFCSFVMGVATIKQDKVPSMNMYLLQDTAIYSLEEHFIILVSVSVRAVISS